MSSKGHYFRPYAPAMLERSAPDMSKDREAEAKQRDADRRFVDALMAAFERGEFPQSAKPVADVPKTRPIPAKRHTLFTVWEDDNA